MLHEGDDATVRPHWEICHDIELVASEQVRASRDFGAVTRGGSRDVFTECIVTAIMGLASQEY